MRRRRHTAAALAAFLTASTAVAAAPAQAGADQGAVHPTLRPYLAAYYDFEHPVRGNPAKERDQGFSRTDIDLVNGGALMRTADGGHRGSRTSIQVRQVSPDTAGNDDWKAGVYGTSGVPTLKPFNAVKGITVMGWFKMTGPNPSPNSNTAAPDDYYGAVGLAGVLSGDSDGHAVRALLEIINVNGELRLVALGRRIDGASSQTFAASQDWRTLLPDGTWVFLAATFDFDTGAMALYRNGQRLDGFYAVAGDPWDLSTPGPHKTSPTDPRGIKIGGSFPQNTAERNPCDCRMDSLMFLNRAVDGERIRAQYRLVSTGQN
ncbi:LamG domain-containing protein [Streptomyces montanus]|uniref:LamG domain-containing protein n=1 Tax=Streptomyces montanus TaxID=2580423 RepID=A0A5R9G0D1_9ACTN|nr:LamG-like jellyroll fold domain-containing protein [Streptomyces montanus]TLS46978.1 LamG domain-containing protein [Streptomyces montanus]